MAFVKVHPALHHGHGCVAQCANDELTFVTLHGRAGKTGDVGVGDANGVGDLVSQRAQAATQYHQHTPGSRMYGADICSGAMNVFQEVAGGDRDT
jgi:hypothetical protein